MNRDSAPSLEVDSLIGTAGGALQAITGTGWVTLRQAVEETEFPRPGIY